MNIFKSALLATVFTAAAAVPSFAQDAMAGHDMSAMDGDSSMAAELPEICKSAEAMAGDMSMDMSHNMDEAHTDLMAGMDVTNKQMMNGMMVEDVDVAFVCGMIPHHQGAINMAKAELEHGPKTWPRR
jgi:uncharacterized protein (DUF305 family)